MPVLYFRVTKVERSPTGELIILPCALKHGVTQESIECAWDNFVEMCFRGTPNEGEVVVIGYDRQGRPIEIIAAERPFGIVVYHANTPPSASVLIELGLAGR